MDVAGNSYSVLMSVYGKEKADKKGPGSQETVSDRKSGGWTHLP